MQNEKIANPAKTCARKICRRLLQILVDVLEQLFYRTPPKTIRHFEANNTDLSVSYDYGVCKQTFWICYGRISHMKTKILADF